MANMIPISTVTVGSSGASSITFSNIPQTYTDLVIKFSGQNNNGSADLFYIQFNESSSNFSTRYLYGRTEGSGSGTFTSSGLLGWINRDMIANAFGSAEIYIFNYASSNNKSYSSDTVSENNAANGTTLAFLAGLWSNTSPITSITVRPGTNETFLQYSSATLYGIRKY
jgi:hypothetical protein